VPFVTAITPSPKASCGWSWSVGNGTGGGGRRSQLWPPFSVSSSDGFASGV